MSRIALIQGDSKLHLYPVKILTKLHEVAILLRVALFTTILAHDRQICNVNKPLLKIVVIIMISVNDKYECL